MAIALRVLAQERAYIGARHLLGRFADAGEEARDLIAVHDTTALAAGAVVDRLQPGVKARLPGRREGKVRQDTYPFLCIGKQRTRARVLATMYWGNLRETGTGAIYWR